MNIMAFPAYRLVKQPAPKFGAIEPKFRPVWDALGKSLDNWQEFGLFCILLGTRKDMIVGSSTPLNHAIFELAQKAERQGTIPNLAQVLSFKEAIGKKLSPDQVTQIISQLQIPVDSAPQMKALYQKSTTRTVWEEEFQDAGATPGARILSLLVGAKASGQQDSLEAALQPYFTGDAEFISLSQHYKTLRKVF